MSRFVKDVKRDGILVDAAMNDLLPVAAIRLGLSPDDAFVHHPKWLKRQSDSYRQEVVAEVMRIQDARLPDGAEL